MSDLLVAMEQLTRPRLLVVGDIILDRYSWGNADRVSPEAPVMVLKIDQREARLGGAASVAFLLRGLEAEVSLIGVVGDDASGRTTAQLLNDERIGTSGVFAVGTRPTTTKERFIGRAAGRHAFQMLRVDDEVTAPIDKSTEERLISVFEGELAHIDAVLVSDYGKGVCTHRLLRILIDRCHASQVPIVIDPARAVDFERYRGATLLKPNRLEAMLATGMAIDTPQDAVDVAVRLIRDLSIKTSVVTLDCEGMVLATHDGVAEHIPTVPREVYDITGAGDMALAMLGVAIASKISLPMAVRLGNIASSLEVERYGVAAVSRKEIRESIVSSQLSSLDVCITQA